MGSHLCQKYQSLFVSYKKGEQRYNLEAIIRRDHKSHMGSPCRSVFALIVIQCSLLDFKKVSKI